MYFAKLWQDQSRVPEYAEEKTESSSVLLSLGFIAECQQLCGRNTRCTDSSCFRSHGAGADGLGREAAQGVGGYVAGDCRQASEVNSV